MVDVDPVSGDVIVVAVVLIQVEHLLKEINFLKISYKSILWQPVQRPNLKNLSLGLNMVGFT